jgi:long-chain-fatty-acid--[acyl-carrier-protein] ligase
VVLFTSGSENLPKAVPLTHANLLANLRDICAVFRFGKEDRLIGILPPFHSFGLTATLLLPVCTGVPVVYHPNPTEGAMLARLIEAYGVTLLVGTPTFLAGILRAVQGSELRTLRAAISGAEKCPAQLRETIQRVCPQLKVIEGYGITECSPVVSLGDDDKPLAGTIGKVLPSVEFVVVDMETGLGVAPGATGMLWVRGPSVFGGYLNYEGPSPFVEREGKQWYQTGDLVTGDAAGVLTFAGRLKRFVKLGGEMISLPAIEEVLARHYVKTTDADPVLAVEASAAELNPELVLFTVRDLDREEVNTLIKAAGLSSLHNIRVIRKLDKIPTLGTGKIDYRALRTAPG